MALDKLVDSTQLDTDLTSVANAIRAKGGTSAQLAFPAGFVDAVEAIETGGGSTLIASGSWTGTGDYKATIPVGKKMPQTDFLFEMSLDTEIELPYDNRYKTLLLSVAAYKKLGRFDLSTDGTKSAVFQTQYNAYNSDSTLTTVKPERAISYGAALSKLSITYGDFLSQNVKIIRNDSGFSVFVNRGNASCPFLSGETFYWNLYYFGDDPQNDIVEVE